MDCLVSVIVPVHNTVEYLPRCIDSIRNQSLKDIEIILSLLVTNCLMSRLNNSSRKSIK